MAKPRAKAKAKPKKASGRKNKAKPKVVKAKAKRKAAVPEVVVETPSAKRRAKTAKEWAARSSPVVEIIDDPHPIGALRRFLEGIKGSASDQQAQIVLGAAQLILFPSAREGRGGGGEVEEIVDLVLERWSDLGERRNGYHAQEFLRHALGAIGVDRGRIGKLAAAVPANATADLLFDVARAHAVARDKVAMLRAVERALDAGTTAEQVRRDHDFAPYVGDPDLGGLLARAEVPPIPVDIAPYVADVRRALDSLVAALREYGETVELRPPVRLDAILDAERAHRISLPNDYRALLTITNGMRLWGYEFFGVGDYRDATPLAVRAQRYLAASGISGSVPLAFWSDPSEWLLYDLRGQRYVLGDRWLPDLATALVRIETAAHEDLGTN